MFPGALQIFQSYALQSGDQESAKKFIRDLNIAWASKLGEQNYQRRETGMNNFVWKWPGTNNMAACSRVAS